MRYVSSIPPATAGPHNSQVPGLVAIHAVKPVHSLEQTVVQVNNPHGKQEVSASNGREPLLNSSFEERRKTCRRIHQQKVLIELRSEVDRRRHNLHGDAVEHIDEEV